MTRILDEISADLLEKAAAAATEASELAGAIARERFGGHIGVEYKGTMGDLVTEVDRLADSRIVELLQSRFPDHRIHSEEAGENGVQSDFVWHVDPLDGTNNYALGIPLYGVCISLSWKGTPIIGVVHDSALCDTYAAVRLGGAWRNGDRIASKPAPAGLVKGTLSWIQGHAVGKRDETCLRLRHLLEANVKRVMRVWAPSLTWAMLARGDIQGIVLYNSEGDDLYAGMLLAQEAGALITDFAGNPVDRAGEQPYLVAAHPDDHAELLAIVQEAIAAR